MASCFRQFGGTSGAPDFSPIFSSAGLLPSWAFYGSGAGVELAAKTAQERGVISLKFSALAGAFLVGVAGAKWITNEVDKKLLKESVKIAGTQKLTEEECQKLVEGPALTVLNRVERAAQANKAA
jgi:hypothetical protein